MKKYKLKKDLGDLKAGTIIDLDEKEAKGLIEAGILEEVDDDGVSSEVAEQMEGVKTEIATAIKQLVTDLTKTGDAGDDGDDGEDGKKGKKKPNVTDVHDREEDDPTGGFKTYGEFAKSVKAASNGHVDKRLKILAGIDEKAAQGANEAVGEEGAWLTPPEYSNRLLERAQEGELGVLGQCDQLVLSGNSIVVNGQVDDDKNAVATRYGGVIAYWVGEADQITSSKLKFRQVTLRLNKIAALCYATDEELEDSQINFGDRLLNRMAGAIGGEVLEAVMFGNGVKKPLGAFAAPCCIEVAKEAGQAADTIVFLNVVNMQTVLWSKSYGTAQWFHNQEALPQMIQMHMPVTTSGAHIPVYMPASGVSEKPFPTLFGRPVSVTDHCEALGDAGDITLGDFSQYLLATRGTVKTAMSIHLRFDYDEVAFKSTFRIDGKPAWAKSMKPRKGASTFRVSPFIKLAARA